MSEENETIVGYAEPLCAWYVARPNHNHDDDFEYLHADGVWREGTLYNGRYLGELHR